MEKIAKKLVVYFSVVLAIIVGALFYMPKVSEISDYDMFINYVNSVNRMSSTQNIDDNINTCIDYSRTVRGYISINEFCDLLDIDYYYDMNSRYIYVEREGFSFTYNFDSEYLLVNGNDIVLLQNKPNVLDTIVYMHIADIANNLGLAVNEGDDGYVIYKQYGLKRLLLQSNSAIKICDYCIGFAESYNYYYTLYFDTEYDLYRAWMYYKDLPNIIYATPDSFVSLPKPIKIGENNNDLNVAPIEKVEVKNFTNEANHKSWGASYMGVDDYWAGLNTKLSGANKNNVIVAVIDTGIDSDHAGLSDRISSGGVGFGYDGNEDDQGHGTHVAGSIVDLTQDNVSVLAYKALGSDGSGTANNILMAMEVLRSQSNDNIRVLNMSLGLKDSNNVDYSSSLFDAFNTKVQNLIGVGISVVVASGNDSVNFTNKVLPADIPDVVTINSVDTTNSSAIGMASGGQMSNVDISQIQFSSSFSNYGANTDFCAPGGGYNLRMEAGGLHADAGILSARMGGGYTQQCGTSMATPHASAAFASLYSDSSRYLSTTQAYDLLKYTAVDLGASGKDIYYGNGFINIAEAYKTDGLTTPTITRANGTATITVPSGCSVYYTLDDAVPYMWNTTGHEGKGVKGSTATLLTSTSTINVDDAKTIKAVAVWESEDEILRHSDVVDSVGVIPDKFNSPSIDYVINDDEMSVSVSISYTSGATNYGEKIYYTLDGSDPFTYDTATSRGTISGNAIEYSTNFNLIAPVNKVVKAGVAYIGGDGVTVYQVSDVVDKHISYDGAWSIDSSGVVTGYKGQKLTLKVPSKINEITPIKIADNFAGNIFDASNNPIKTTLQSIEFADTITSIGTNAFNGCVKLANVNNADNIQSIGANAFMGCSELTSANFPKVHQVGDGVFKNCSSLQTVSFNTLTIVSKDMFYSCDIRVIDRSNFVLVSSIQENAFYNNVNLTTVNLYSSNNPLTLIGDGAFYGCTSLNSVIVTDKNSNTHSSRVGSLKQIGANAFYGCTSLSMVDLWSAETIGEQAFYGDSSLNSVYLPKVQSIGVKAFYNTGLNKIICAGSSYTLGTDVLPSGTVDVYAYEGSALYQYASVNSHNVHKLIDTAIKTQNSTINYIIDTGEKSVVFEFIEGSYIDSPAKIIVSKTTSSGTVDITNNVTTNGLVVEYANVSTANISEQKYTLTISPWDRSDDKSVTITVKVEKDSSMYALTTSIKDSAGIKRVYTSMSSNALVNDQDKYDIGSTVYVFVELNDDTASTKYLSNFSYTINGVSVTAREGTKVQGRIYRLPGSVTIKSNVGNAPNINSVLDIEAECEELDYTLRFYNDSRIIYSKKVGYSKLKDFNYVSVPSKSGETGYTYVFMYWECENYVDKDGTTRTLRLYIVNSAMQWTLDGDTDNMGVETDASAIMVTQDIDLIANYNKVVNEYDINVYTSDGGQMLATIKVQHSNSITEEDVSNAVVSSGNTLPTKEATVQYTYSIYYSTRKNVTPSTGYTSRANLNNITSSKDIYVAFLATIRKYTITWKLNNGQADVQTECNYNAMPSISNPTRDSDIYYAYSFSRWQYKDGEDLRDYVHVCTGDETYYALYTQRAIKYKYYFYNETEENLLEDGEFIVNDGNKLEAVLSSDNSRAFVTLDAVTKSGTESKVYVFDYWQIKYFDSQNNEKTNYSVDGNVYTLADRAGANSNVNFAPYTIKFYAKFAETDKIYTLQFYNVDGKTLLGTAEAKYGEYAEVPSNINVSTLSPQSDSWKMTGQRARYTYAFADWTTKAGGSEKSDLKITGSGIRVYASFTATPIEYSVQWKNGGIVLYEVKIKDREFVYPNLPSASSVLLTIRYDNSKVENKVDSDDNSIVDSNNNPIKSHENKHYYYNWIGWEYDGSTCSTTQSVAISKNTVCEARFVEVVRQYTYRFIDNTFDTTGESADVLGSEVVDYNTVVDEPGNASSRRINGKKTNVYVYTFIKYVGKTADNEQRVIVALKDGNLRYFDSQTGVYGSTWRIDTDIDFYIVYDRAFVEYTVDIYSFDGSEKLNSQTVKYGSAIDFNIVNVPMRAENEKYLYQFAGWSRTADTSGNNLIDPTHAMDADVWTDEELKSIYSDIYNSWTNKDSRLNHIIANTTIYAYYNATIRTYVITWVDGNGDTLANETVGYGQTIEYKLSDYGMPTKKSTYDKKYRFDNKWLDSETNKLLDASQTAKQNVTYVALFTQSERYYSIVFKNYNQEIVYQRDFIGYLDNGEYNKDTLPARIDESGKFSYTFDCWSSKVDKKDEVDLRTINASIIDKLADDNDNIIVFACFIEEINKFTVVFYVNDYIYKTVTVEWSDTCIVDTPTKDKDVRYTYTFSNWSQSDSKNVDATNILQCVKENITVYAWFNTTINSYTIKWSYTYVDSDGVGHPKEEIITAKYGDIVNTTLEVKREYILSDQNGDDPHTQHRHWEHTGWNYTTWWRSESEKDTGVTNVDGVLVIGNMDLSAILELKDNLYKYTYLDYDNRVLYTGFASFKMPIYIPTSPKRAEDVQYSYTFYRWITTNAQEVNVGFTIQSDTTINAEYTRTLRKYYVYFFNEVGDSEITHILVEYGTSAKYTGALPTKESDKMYDYVFANWMDAPRDNQSSQVANLDNITGTTRVYASFTPVLKMFVITWKNGDSVLYTDSLPYGSSIAFDSTKCGAITKESTEKYDYEFDGFEEDVDNIVVVQDITIHAKFARFNRVRIVDGINTVTGDNLDARIILDNTINADLKISFDNQTILIDKNDLGGISQNNKHLYVNIQKCGNKLSFFKRLVMQNPQCYQISIKGDNDEAVDCDVQVVVHSVKGSNIKAYKIDGKKLSALKVVCDKFDATITTNNGIFVIGNESYLMIAIIVVVLGGCMAVVVCVKVVKRKKQNEMIKKLNQKQDEIIKAKNNNASINNNQINANVQEAKIESAEEQLLRLAKEFERKNKKLYMQFVKNANLSVASSEDEKIILFYMYYNRDKMN